MKRLEWGDEAREEFASSWPCCDVPFNGWAVFDDNGDLVDLSDGTGGCEVGGGLSEFLTDLYEKEVEVSV